MFGNARLTKLSGRRQMFCGEAIGRFAHVAAM